MRVRDYLQSDQISNGEKYDSPSHCCASHILFSIAPFLAVIHIIYVIFSLIRIMSFSYVFYLEFSVQDFAPENCITLILNVDSA
jgi:hypothetical protein